MPQAGPLFWVLGLLLLWGLVLFASLILNKKSEKNLCKALSTESVKGSDSRKFDW